VDAVGLERVVTVGNLLQRAVDMIHRQREKQSEATRVLLHHLRALFVAGAGESISLVRAVVESRSGCRNRGDGHVDIVLAHFLERPFRRPFASAASTHRCSVVMNVDAACARTSAATPGSALLRNERACRHCFYEVAAVGHALNLGKRRSALPRSIA
jgi:hypothetical protein